MDVELPDGTVIEGVPQGTTRSAIVARLQRAGRDIPAEWLQPDAVQIDPAAIARGGEEGTVAWMSPKDFLRLSPSFEDDPGTDRKGRSLRASLDAGEPINNIPEWTVTAGKIVHHDGRHRAKELHDAGVREIPVLIRGDLSGVRHIEAQNSKDRIALSKWQL